MLRGEIREPWQVIVLVVTAARPVARVLAAAASEHEPRLIDSTPSRKRDARIEGLGSERTALASNSSGPRVCRHR